jgi:hypothetical protein
MRVKSNRKKIENNEIEIYIYILSKIKQISIKIIRTKIDL